MRGSEFAELRAFMTVVEEGAFARAAARLRLSPSTLSQTIRELEERLGVRLLHRTTRSLSLTDAGARLHARLLPLMHELGAAVQDVRQLGGAPAGTVRLHLPRLAAARFLVPVLGRFLDAHPNVTLDVTVDDAVIDLVAAGFDLDVRLGELLTPDTVAVPLGGELRQIAVASPEYLARHGHPGTPADLLRHRCINWRQPGSAGVYRWEFAQDGRWFSVAVNGPLIASDRDLTLEAAVQGVGIAYWSDVRARPLIEAGQLVPLLGAWSPPFPGWHLYRPKRPQTPPAVLALVDFLQAACAPLVEGHPWPGTDPSKDPGLGVEL